MTGTGHETRVHRTVSTMAGMGNGLWYTVWPEWKIVKRIGSGSYGVVYEVVRTDNSVRSSAAVKVITIPRNEAELESLSSMGVSSETSGTYLREVVDEFVNEIQMMESLKGAPNIVTVEDYQVVENKMDCGWNIYIRMELLTPLKEHLNRNHINENEALILGCDICSALERCAKLHVIHRDIKPDNIFVNAFGDYKLGDFGVARTLESISRGLSQKGTYNYIAPEIVKGNRYNETVDIYSLGIVLYWLLNRQRLPFLSLTQSVINPQDIENANLRRISGEIPPPPCDASPVVSDVILRACSPDPGKRFVSASEMKKALRSIEKSNYSRMEEEMDKTMTVRHPPREGKDIFVCSNPGCRKQLNYGARFCPKCGSPAVREPAAGHPFIPGDLRMDPGKPPALRGDLHGRREAGPVHRGAPSGGLRGDLAGAKKKSGEPREEHKFFTKPGELE